MSDLSNKNNNIEIKYSNKKKYQFTRELMFYPTWSLLKRILLLQLTWKNDYDVLIAKILSDQKLDPTIINGGVINSFKSNVKLGKGDWAILEADESMEALKLPKIIIVTNLDHEHMDYYKNFKNLENSLLNLLKKLHLLENQLFVLTIKI